MKMKNKKNPKPMRFQPRDNEIIFAIFKYDGVLSRRHLKVKFWPNATTQAMERRLSLLKMNGFLDWPSKDHRRIHPISEPVIWLGWRGILHIAGSLEIVVKPPVNHRENQLRLLARRLREAGIRWQREPRWSQLAHDIAVNDFRLAVEGSVEKWPSLTLETWLPEGEFLTDTDTIEFAFTNRNGRSIKKRRGIRPDGFFVILDHLRQINGSPARARYLLELDNSTHPLDRFGNEKAIAGLEYIRSQAYKDRFKFNSGRWLIVCVSPKRMANLKSQTEKVLGNEARNFYFTTLDKTTPKTVFNAPIWLQGGAKNPETLVTTIRGE
jgi:hypothetical protein